MTARRMQLSVILTLPLFLLISCKFLTKKDEKVILEQQTAVDQGPPLKLTVAAFYYPEEEKVIALKMKISRTDSAARSAPAPDDKTVPFVTFQLRCKGRVVQEVKQPHYDVVMEESFEDGTRKRVDFPASLHAVALEIPDESEWHELRIYVISHKGNVIYFSPIPEAAHLDVHRRQKE
ncbi:MAG: hypothetical protein OXP66_19255 [Candidatus Tectomicrobia bacterium]|nr:hypothetical protein [Candidatus Tectomicrobia bacterium]